MKVLIFGSDGNMGRRYCAILNHLGHETVGMDLGYDQRKLREVLPLADKVIVASSTPAHLDNLIDICCARPPDQEMGGKLLDILCEKPVVKTLRDLEVIKNSASGKAIRLFCVNQYRYLSDAWLADGEAGHTHYNYWNHGKDGLAWDCFQIIGLANGCVELREDSPIWKCWINDTHLDIGGMDQAYVDMVDDFLTEQKLVWGIEDIERITRKVLEICEGRVSS